ncbi:hypothetical protein Q7P37_001380 [Cladosporium fusiforme]
MLGRQVTAALRRPLQARLRTATGFPTQHNLCIRTFSHAPRHLNPGGRPKKAVGEPSKPIKRAVKAAAKKPASEKTDAAAKKLAAKKKLAEKKAAAAKKAKAKRVLTPEQLERKKAAVRKAATKELKKAALEPPKLAKAHTYLAFLKERSQSAQKKPSTMSQNEFLAQSSKEASAAYKNLTPAEIEHYNHLAHTTKEKSVAEYKRWVESHSVEEIAVANTARRALRRQTDKKGQNSKYPEIEDERQVKKAATAYIQFYTSRQASGDFKTLPFQSVRSSLVKNGSLLTRARGRTAGPGHLTDILSPQKYDDLAAQDSDRYSSEYTSVYGHSPAEAQAAAAAVA